MNARIKRALEALADIAGFGDGPGYNVEDCMADELSAVRSALEAAQQEVDAWEVINFWCSASGPEGPEREAMCECSGTHGNGGKWRVSLNHDYEQAFASSNISRLKALTEAAAWCRAELAK